MDDEKNMAIAIYQDREFQKDIEKTASKKKPGREPVLINMGDVKPVDVSYVWPPYIPAGKLTSIDGDPCVGKSMLALMLAATVSIGGFLPGPDGVPDQKVEPGQVLYMTAEDGLADTIRPRLDKMGADPNKIYILKAWKKGDKEGSITLNDVDVIRGALDQIQPDLLIVDPLQGFLGAGVDMFRSNETRPVLAKLGALAEEYDTTIILIRHLTKHTGKAIYRGQGSIDFSAAVRSVIMLADLDGDGREKGLAHKKHNLSERGKNLKFVINDQGFFWAGLCDDDIDNILSGNGGNDDERSALEEAREFLEETLKNGPVACREILDEAGELQISKRTLERAKAEMKIISIKQGGKWFWKAVSPNNGGVGGVGDVEKNPVNKGKNEDRQDRQEKGWQPSNGDNSDNSEKEPATFDQAKLIFS